MDLTDAESSQGRQQSGLPATMYTPCSKVKLRAGSLPVKTPNAMATYNVAITEAAVE